jgi:hypothetical protein
MIFAILQFYNFILVIVTISGFRGLVVSVLAFGTQVRGFKLGQPTTAGNTTTSAFTRQPEAATAV